MRIFLTGGTGFLGSNIVKVAVERYRAEVFTTVNRWHSNEPQPFDYAAVDITNCIALTSAVREFQPDVIIHSAILNDFVQMYADRALAWRNYVESTRCLCEVANSIDAKLIFVSTDWVFDGTQSPAAELTPPNPINYYGVLKVVGETLVMSMARNGAVARVAGVSGTHWLRPAADQGQNAGFGYFAASVVKSLQAGQPLVVWEGAINMRATPGLASENAKLIVQIAKQDRQGVYHCCAGDAVSRLELAHIIADVFELDAGLINTGPPPPNDPAALIGYPVPRDTSLDANQSASILGYTLPSVRKLMEKYQHEVTTGTLA